MIPSEDRRWREAHGASSRESCHGLWLHHHSAGDLEILEGQKRSHASQMSLLTSYCRRRDPTKVTDEAEGKLRPQHWPGIWGNCASVMLQLCFTVRMSSADEHATSQGCLQPPKVLSLLRALFVFVDAGSSLLQSAALHSLRGSHCHVTLRRLRPR